MKVFDWYGYPEWFMTTASYINQEIYEIAEPYLTPDRDGAYEGEVVNKSVWVYFLGS